MTLAASSADISGSAEAAAVSARRSQSASGAAASAPNAYSTLASVRGRTPAGWRVVSSEHSAVKRPSPRSVAPPRGRSAAKRCSAAEAAAGDSSPRSPAVVARRSTASGVSAARSAAMSLPAPFTLPPLLELAPIWRARRPWAHQARAGTRWGRSAGALRPPGPVQRWRATKVGSCTCTTYGRAPRQRGLHCVARHPEP